MAQYNTKQIRNIALAGHGGSGKTSLAEAMLFVSGGTDRLGNVPDGNTVCDYDAEEIKRGFSISSAIAPVIWKDIKVNVLDTPGYLDFVGESLQALRVADSAVILVDGKAGIEVGTELAWSYATDAGLPKAFFIVQPSSLHSLVAVSMASSSFSELMPTCAISRPSIS